MFSVAYLPMCRGVKLKERVGEGRGYRESDGRPSGPPPDGRLSTAFREDFNMRGREEQEHGTPRDRRGGEYRHERGQRVLFEEARGQDGEGINPAWSEEGAGGGRYRQAAPAPLEEGHKEEPPASDVELTSLINAAHRSECGDDGDCDVGDALPAADKFYLAKAIRCLSVISGTMVLILLLLFYTRSESSVASAGDVDSSETPDGIVCSSLRWKPVDDADNCYLGFRLANATLHCGIGDKSPLTTDFDGTRYCGGVELEPNSCTLPTEGMWELPSRENESMPVPPLHGRFGINSSASNSTLPRCKTMEQVIDGSLNGDGEWVPHTCSAVPLSPFIWTENAQCQTTITMMGDSHIRNLFSATVYGLRGVDAFAEGHSSDAKAGGVVRSYEWRWQDGVATDRLLMHTHTNRQDPTPFEDCPCHVVQRCLRIAFVWAPTFGEQETALRWAQQWQSDLVVVAPGNSYEVSVVLSATWTAGFDALLERNPTTHLSLLHFSWGKQPAGRPAALTTWTNVSAGAGRMSYLPQSAIMQGDNKQSRATWHFACSLEKVDVENDLINAVEPCWDITDTAQIRAIVTVHFDAFVNDSKGPL